MHRPLWVTYLGPVPSTLIIKLSLGLKFKRPVFVVLRLEAVEEVVVRRHILLLLLSGLQRAELRTGVGALN